MDSATADRLRQITQTIIRVSEGVGVKSIEIKRAMSQLEHWRDELEEVIAYLRVLDTSKEYTLDDYPFDTRRNK